MPPNIVYGTNSENKPLEKEKVDEKFKTLMADLSKKFNAKSHKVKDEDGNVLDVELHADVKGILGAPLSKLLLVLLPPLFPPLSTRKGP